jgi:hypothetical protein
MEFVDELKSRMQDAQRRLTLAQQEMQVAQAKYQSVAQEFGSLQHLLNVEIAAQQKAQETQGYIFTVDQAPTKPQLQAGISSENKTDAVRKLLSQYPTGITPSDLWKQIQTQMKHRAYLYSILKRLRDKEEVMVRRGKYILKIVPKTEEERERPTLH